jgi:hypothetical protein
LEVEKEIVRTKQEKGCDRFWKHSISDASLELLNKMIFSEEVSGAMHSETRTFIKIPMYSANDH